MSNLPWAEWKKPRSEPLAAATRDALAGMESLGNDCEFGAVQKAASLDPLGLFRWASTTPAGLTLMLDRGFDGLDSFDELDTFAGSKNEVYLRHRGYAFSCHCFTHPGPDWRAHREKERRRLTLLIRKLREDLAVGRRLFVFKSRDPIEIAAVRRLVEALRRHGPNDLLWVIEAARPALIGRVRWLETGLLQGAVDRFAPESDPLDVSFEAWSRLAVAAASLRARSPPQRLPTAVRRVRLLARLLPAFARATA